MKMFLHVAQCLGSSYWSPRLQISVSLSKGQEDLSFCFQPFVFDCIVPIQLQHKSVNTAVFGYSVPAESLDKITEYPHYILTTIRSVHCMAVVLE